MKRKYFKRIRESVWNIILIRVLMGFIGIGASVLSCYYTSVWLFEFLPPFLAVFLSFIMILFSVLAFQTIIFIWQQKEHPKRHLKWYRWVVLEVRQNFLVVVFSILWVIVAVFSMGSTVAGQYNKYVAQERQQVIEQEQTDTTKNQLLITELKTSEKTTLSNIDEKKRYREHIVSSLEQFKTIQEQIDKQKEYNDLRRRLTVTDKEIDSLLRTLTTTREEIQELIKTTDYTIVVKQDFYTWIATLLGFSKDMIQFIFSIFPALFIDIIAPTGVAVALFLKKRLT